LFGRALGLSFAVAFTGPALGATGDFFYLSLPAILIHDFSERL
jgi:hypothetical protein